MNRILIVLWVGFMSFSFTPTSEAQTIAEQKDVVAFLFGTVHPLDKDHQPLKAPDGKPLSVEVPLGTAFFVFYPDTRGGPNYGFAYLVTAKHVLKDADGTFLREVKLRLNLKGGDGVSFVEHIPVLDGQGKLTWFHDDDDAVDVVAYPLLPDQKKYQFRAIPLSMFATDATFRENNVGEGDVLYFIGLMAQYYGTNKNYPVIRRGALAMMTDEKIDTPTGLQNTYIGELASWPGNSGSPVFLDVGGLRHGALIMGGNTISFVGILSGSFLNKFSATVPDTTTFIAGSDQETGISFIVPAAKLKEVLESAPARTDRDEEFSAKPLLPQN